MDLASKRVPGLHVVVVTTAYHFFRMTQAEIAAALATSQRTVRLFMRRAGIAARVAAKRDQGGEKNSNWRGRYVTYKGAHSRVRLSRGEPTQCRRCGSGEQVEWANLSGALHDPNDYEEMCRSCHRKFDGAHRNFKGATGGRPAAA